MIMNHIYWWYDKSQWCFFDVSESWLHLSRTQYMDCTTQLGTFRQWVIPGWGDQTARLASPLGPVVWDYGGTPRRSKRFWDSKSLSLGWATLQVFIYQHLAIFGLGFEMICLLSCVWACEQVINRVKGFSGQPKVGPEQYWWDR
jgi:hypothetical protein